MEDYLGNIEGRVKKFKPDRLFVYAHLKRDGYCIQARKYPGGTLKVNTRHPSYHTSQQDWYKMLDEKLPPNSCVLGELFVEGGESTDVRSVLAEQPTKEGIFEVFCMPLWAGKDIRTAKIKEVEEFSNKVGLPFIPVHTGLSRGPIPKGYEGYVLKTNHYPQFPWDWMKLKSEYTADLKIKGFLPGEGKYEGLIGSIVLESDDGTIKGAVSGMTDADREYFTKHQKVLLHTVVEISFQKIVRTGGIRHGQFKKLRFDKKTTSSIKDFK